MATVETGEATHRQRNGSVPRRRYIRGYGYQEKICPIQGRARLMPVNWLTIRRFSEESGYTENAIRTKIKERCVVGRPGLAQGPGRESLDQCRWIPPMGRRPDISILGAVALIEIAITDRGESW